MLIVRVILEETNSMYSYHIKWSGILSFGFVIFAGYFLQSTFASASVLAGVSSDVNIGSGTHITRTLHYGMRGGDVKNLQVDLSELISLYPSGKVTGFFGPATAAAVSRLQKQEKANLESASSATKSTTKLGTVDTQTANLIRLRVTQKKCPLDMRSRQKCLEENYTHYANSQGVDIALRLLSLEVNEEPQFEGMCHSVMHLIAHAAVHEFKNFGVAMNHGTTLCQNGYYHGVIEEYLRNENVDALSGDDLRNFCPTSFKATSSPTDTLNCIHGIGHALMYMTRNDLPKSLVRCGDFLDDHMRSQCLTGAFMQEGFMATSSKQSVIDKDVQGCSQSQHQDECFIALSAKAMHDNGASAKIVERFCDTLIDINTQRVCKNAVINTN